jgi:ribosomal protein L21E
MRRTSKPRKRKKEHQSTNPKFDVGWAVNVKFEPGNLNATPTWQPGMDRFRGRVGKVISSRQLADGEWGYQIDITDIDCVSYAYAYLFREEWLTEHHGDQRSPAQQDATAIRSRWESICAEKED